MKLLSLGALASVLLVVAPAWAGDGSCKAVAKGAAGERVISTFTVQGGTITSRDVVWSPPRADGAATEVPELEIHYWPVTDTGPADPTAVDAGMFLQKGGSEYVGAKVTLVLDGVGTWDAPLRTTGFFSKDTAGPSMLAGLAQLAAIAPGFPPKNTDLLDKIKTARQATVTFSSPTGTTIVEATFDLTNQTSREALLHQAWNDAAQAAAAPAPCHKARVHPAAN